jgi:hypothetical protein
MGMAASICSLGDGWQTILFSDTCQLAFIFSFDVARHLIGSTDLPRQLPAELHQNCNLFTLVLLLYCPLPYVSICQQLALRQFVANEQPIEQLRSDRYFVVIAAEHGVHTMSKRFVACTVFEPSTCSEWG